MAIAMPVTDGFRVAGHFAKASAFAVYSDEGRLLRIDNPQQGGCDRRQRLVAQLTEMRVSRVVLRNIGERSLARLLGAGIQVERLARGATIAQVLADEVATRPMTAASQGRPCKANAGASRLLDSVSSQGQESLPKLDLTR